jgi:hypothetical protein
MHHLWVGSLFDRQSDRFPQALHRYRTFLSKLTLTPVPAILAIFRSHVMITQNLDRGE